MSLRGICRELVLESLIRRSIAVEGSELAGRIQLVVDELTLRVLTSFLRMADLHAEGVTSVELVERQREPLPDIDALYIVKPEEAKVANILDDFKIQGSPQHCQVHLAFTDFLPPEQMERLASGAHLAPRIRTLVEAPLTFIAIEDRGFHFDLPQALPRLFPRHEHETELVKDIAHRLADVCACLQSTQPNIRHAGSPLCKDLAQQLQQELSVQRRPLGRSNKANDVPCQVLIVDRSVDMAATLVHEYTYEALAYDVLDGSLLDIDHHIVTQQQEAPRMASSPTAQTHGFSHMIHKATLRNHSQDTIENGSKQALLSEADPIWERYRHEHISTAQEQIRDKIAGLAEEASKDRDMSDLKPHEALEQLRKLPEFRDTFEKLQMHTNLLKEINVKLKDDAVITSGLGNVEQDVACGIDKSGKDVKATSLQENISKLFHNPEVDLPSEVKLRLLMLYFACVANVPEAVRKRLIESSRLEDADGRVLLSMMETKLMEVPDSQRHKLGSGCVHRVTKTQAARFKKNARADGTFVLSRFEPRVKELLEQLAENRLNDEDFPALGGSGAAQAGLRFTAGAAGGAPTPSAPAVDDWSFVSAPDCGGPDTNPFAAAEEVSQRFVVFIIGGITYSELRAGAEVAQSLSRGAEVYVGGTAVLTPRKLIQLLRPSSNPFDDTGGGDVDAENKV